MSCTPISSLAPKPLAQSLMTELLTKMGRRPPVQLRHSQYGVLVFRLQAPDHGQKHVWKTDNGQLVPADNHTCSLPAHLQYCITLNERMPMLRYLSLTSYRAGGR